MSRWPLLAVSAMSIATVGCPASRPISFHRPLIPPSARTSVGLPKAVGAGATFPDPLYQKWIDAYKQSHPGVGLEYKSVGSLQGLVQLYDYKVDFGGSDWPQDVDKPTTRQFPTVAGAVVVIYNIDGLNTDLELTPKMLGGILGGSVKTWNDVRKDLRPNRIAVVHRTDPSGTTRVLSEFLTQRSEGAWTGGADWLVEWPANSWGTDGSDALAKAVYETRNSIGYVEYSYALTNRLRHAFVQNTAEQFVQAKPDTIDAALADLPETDDAQTIALAILRDIKKHHDAYPITAVTWVLAPVQVSNRARTALLGPLGFFPWTMTPPAQAYVEIYGYVKLTPELVAWEQRELDR